MKSWLVTFAFAVAVLFVLVCLGIPISASGQGRGQGRGRGQVNSGLGRKCEKFVNCHDARDGRWDGRGPRRQLSWRDRVFRRRQSDILSNKRNRRWRNERIRVAQGRRH